MATHTGLSDEVAHAEVISWLCGEREYTLKKFGTEFDRTHTQEFANGDMEWWDRQFDNYLHRAKILGLDTPVGRQALAKFVATAAGMLAASIQMYGHLPEAGVPSGEIK